MHTPGHIANIKALSDAGGGEASPLTPLGRGSFEIARLAAGGVIVAVEAVIQGRVSNAYALVRPPATMPLPTSAWAFACSPMPPLRSATHRSVSAFGGSPRSTGTCIMATAANRSSTPTRGC